MKRNVWSRLWRHRKCLFTPLRFRVVLYLIRKANSDVSYVLYLSSVVICLFCRNVFLLWKIERVKSIYCNETKRTEQNVVCIVYIGSLADIRVNHNDEGKNCVFLLLYLCYVYILSWLLYFLVLDCITTCLKDSKDIVLKMNKRINATKVCILK